MWIQEGFTAEALRNDSGADVQWNDSGLGPKFRVPKSELQPGRPPDSEPNRPEKTSEVDLGASTENPPLKPS